ncbi:MAG: chemotaxis-specific protein-glutamate methyltransferase CheB [Magnetococcales bacterium]|nr:chemotaxis-specific protein-glutamate methyltransferase CheB [Magnetococcales bacterium]
MAEPLKVLVVDDTITYRMIVTRVAESIPGVDVAASAPNGKLALAKLETTAIDLVLLDIEMPVMDGLTTLKELSAKHPQIAVVMVSGVSRTNANIVVECLNSGALDFVTKPLEENAERAKSSLKKALEPILSELIAKRNISGASRKTVPPRTAPAPGREAASTSSMAVPLANGKRPLPRAQRLSVTDLRKGATARQPQTRHTPPVTARAPIPARPSTPVPTRPAPRAATSPVGGGPKKPNLILIGSSTGGPAALTQVLSGLGGPLSIPILIVQHMPPIFTASLAAQLSRSSGLTVQESQENMTVKPGDVVLAMGGKHMTLAKQGSNFIVKLNEGPKVNECRPAVDVLFMSAATIDSGNVLSVILTGMGRDGANGVDALKRRGNCYSITQDMNSCVVYGMPRTVEEKGLSDEVLPVDQIGPRIAEICKR